MRIKSDQVWRAALKVHMTWHRHPSYIYTVEDLHSLMVETMMTKPQRYLAPTKRSFLRLNLTRDFNRRVGDELGVPRPGRPAKPFVVTYLHRPDDVASQWAKYLLECAEDDTDKRYPYMTVNVVYGYTIKEIAEMLDVSVSTVVRRIRDERERFIAEQESYKKIL